MAVKMIVDGLGREHHLKLATLAGAEVVRALEQADLTEQLAVDVGMLLVRADLGREVLEDIGAAPDGADLQAGVMLVAKDVIKEWRSLAKQDPELKTAAAALKPPKVGSQLKAQGDKLSEAYLAAVNQAVYDELRQQAGPTAAAKVQRHDTDPVMDAINDANFTDRGSAADRAIAKLMLELRREWSASRRPWSASQINVGDLVETPADIGIVQRVFMDNGERVAEVELLRGHHAREIFSVSEMTLKQTAADVDKQTLKHDLREAEPNWRTTFWLVSLTRSADFVKEAKKLGFTTKEDGLTVGSLDRIEATGDPRKLWQLFMRTEPIATYNGRPGAPGSQELRDVIPDVLKPEALKRAKSYGLAKDTIQSIAAKLATMGYTLKPLPYDLRANSAMYLVTDHAGQSQRLTSKQVQQLAKGKSVKAMVGMGNTLMASLSPAEQETALAALDKRSANGRDSAIRTGFFRGHNSTGLMADWDRFPSKLVSVDSSKLAATQMDVDVAGVKKYIEGKGKTNEPADVVLYRGQYLVADGHHRIAAELLAGKPSVKVKLYTAPSDYQMSFGKCPTEQLHDMISVN